MSLLRSAAAVAALVLSAVALSGCAGAAAAGGPAAPSQEVVGQGLVLDDGGEVELCLGPVATSLPPQCAGIPVDGWSWDALGDFAETQGDLRWGTFAVQGRWDGDRLTVTGDPIPLALYDPAPITTPTPEPGDLTEAEQQEIVDAVPAELGSAFLAATPIDGRVDVDVVFDDGTIQSRMDDAYGAGAVVVRSALRPVG